MNVVATGTKSSVRHGTPVELNYASVPLRVPELHSVISIGLATFIGSILAGAIVLAINFRRLGRRDLVLPTIAAGVAGLAVVLAIAFALPAGAPGFIFVIAQIALARLVATKMFGKQLDTHVQRGGKIASQWKAAGIGAICMVGVLIVILAIVFAM